MNLCAVKPRRHEGFLLPPCRRQQERVPTVTNPNPDTSGIGRGRAAWAVGWIEEDVNAWIRSRIRGVPWVQGPMPRYPTIIRKQELLRRVGLSHVRIWQLEKEGKFPKRVRLTDRAEAPADAAD
jgi:predicted DNA-binding transcriptional regulator AlpA